MIYFTIGLIAGLIVMAVICEKAHRQEVSELKAKIGNDSRYHYETVKSLEDELNMLRNVVKSLNEDNVKLRKKAKANGQEID